MVFEPILVFISLLTTYDGTSERLRFFMWEHVCRRVWQAGQHLLLSNSLGNVAVRSILTAAQPIVCVLLILIAESARGTEKTLGRLVYAEVEHIRRHAIPWQTTHSIEVEISHG